jgi:hypothetical protein
MFTKADKQFDEIAADPVRRRKLIAKLNRGRKWVFGAAVCLLLALCILTIEAIALHHPASAGMHLTVFSAALIWISFLQMQSDLKLLRFIDRLESERT